MPEFTESWGGVAPMRFLGRQDEAASVDLPDY